MCLKHSSRDVEVVGYTGVEERCGLEMNVSSA